MSVATPALPVRTERLWAALLAATRRGPDWGGLLENLVIIAMQRHRPPTVKAARQATATTPIVAIDLETNPVLAGYAASVARPGGNVTGLFIDMSCLAGDVVAAP